MQEACCSVEGDWSSLSAAVAEVLASCDNDRDQQIILSRVASVRDKLARLSDDVKTKATAHQTLAAYLDSCSAAEEKISRLQKQLEDAKLTADMISQLRADFDVLHSQLSQLASRHPEIKAAADKANLEIKDCITQAPVDFDANVLKMFCHVGRSISELDDKAEKLAELAETWRMYSETMTSVERDFQQLQGTISAAQVEELSLAGVELYMQHLLDGQQRWSEITSSYEQLTSTKQHLAMLDPFSIDKSERESGQISAARNILQTVLSGNIDSAALVVEKWQSYDNIKSIVESVCTKAKLLLTERTTLSSLGALRDKLTQIKVFHCFVIFVAVVNFVGMLSTCLTRDCR